MKSSRWPPLLGAGLFTGLLLVLLALLSSSAQAAGCAPDPARDLRGQLLAGGAQGEVVNRSVHCSYRIGIAAYRKFDDVTDHQRIFAWKSLTVAPGATARLPVDLPACAAQIDLFYGPVLQSLDGQRYGPRLLDVRHRLDTQYCRPEPTVTPTEPTVTPTEPTVTPTEPTVTPTEPTVTPTDPAADQTPPCTDSVRLASGQATTTARAIAVEVQASDPTPGSGVEAVLIVEYAPYGAIWVPTQVSPWLPYAGDPSSYAWTLSARAGLRYIQAWSRDRAGNISTCPQHAAISYIPPSDSVGAGESRIYRYDLRAGDRLEALLTPLSGDPDLYLWAPDYEQGRPPWVSNQRDQPDSLALVAPVDGVYQLEVYGFSAAEYRLEVQVVAARSRARAPLAAAQRDKPGAGRPAIPLASAPPLNGPPPALQLWLPQVSAGG